MADAFKPLHSSWRQVVYEGSPIYISVSGSVIYTVSAAVGKVVVSGFWTLSVRFCDHCRQVKHIILDLQVSTRICLQVAVGVIIIMVVAIS